jgi:two-component system, OmpR family, sensor histidine kinase MprB
VTLRLRITLIAAVAVALAFVAASIGIYVATAQTLRSQVDGALRDIASGELAAPIDPDFRGGPRIGRYGGAGGTLQVVRADGLALRATQPGVQVEPLPVGQATIEVARGDREAFFETVRIAGEPVRILTVPAGRGVAVQLARPLTEVEGALDDLRSLLLVAAILGTGLAAGLGAVVARRAIRPIGELTRLAEEIATTRDLTRRLTGDAADQRDDEIGRLAAAFDTMLHQLEQARQSQQQLVADASHELRTPLTSLRTNIEVLARLEELPPDDRTELIDQVIDQLDEFSRLIGGLVELARGETPLVSVREVDLDAVVASVARQLDPAANRVRVRGSAGAVLGDADRLERAVANLVENAQKYAPTGPIELDLAPGEISVRDHGPGIAPEDRPRVLQRFYRAPETRDAPGAGLGLAIVEQTVRTHGGDVEVAEAAGGGCRVTLRFGTHGAASVPPTAAIADLSGSSQARR